MQNDDDKEELLKKSSCYKTASEAIRVSEESRENFEEAFRKAFGIADNEDIEERLNEHTEVSSWEELASSHSAPSSSEEQEHQRKQLMEFLRPVEDKRLSEIERELYCLKQAHL